MADVDEESFRHLSNDVVRQPVGVKYEERATGVSSVCYVLSTGIQQLWDRWENKRELERQSEKVDD